MFICLFCCMKSHRYSGCTPPEKYQQMGFHYELIYLLEPRLPLFCSSAQEIYEMLDDHCINFDMNIYIDRSAYVAPSVSTHTLHNKWLGQIFLALYHRERAQQMDSAL